MQVQAGDRASKHSTDFQGAIRGIQRVCVASVALLDHFQIHVNQIFQHSLYVRLSTRYARISITRGPMVL